MKRFFTLFILAILLLCQNVNAGAQQTNSADESNAIFSVVENQNATDEKPNEHDRESNQRNTNAVRNENFSMKQGFTKFFNKDNVAILISFIALLVAWFSFYVTSDLGKKQLRAYIGVNFYAPCYPENSSNKLLKIRSNLQNFGQTPALVSECVIKIERMNGTTAETIGRFTRKNFIVNPSESLEFDIDPFGVVKLNEVSGNEGRKFTVSAIIKFRDVEGRVRFFSNVTVINIGDFPNEIGQITPLQTISSNSSELKDKT